MLKNLVIPREVLEKIPFITAKTNRLVAFADDTTTLSVATDTQPDQKVLNFISEKTSRKIKLHTTTTIDLETALRQYRQPLIPTTAETDNPLAGKMLAAAISHAQEINATNIHLEPNELDVRLRFRVDGRLLPGFTWPKEIFPNILKILKQLAQLNHQETNQPQDGSLIFPLSNDRIQLNITILPTMFGEKIVLQRLTNYDQHPLKNKTVSTITDN